MILSSTQKLQVVLTAAKTTNDMDCYGSFVDIVGAREGVAKEVNNPGSQVASSNGVTAVDVIAAPTIANANRLIEYFSVYNRDTASKVVKVQVVDSASGTYVLRQATLPAGEALVYLAGSGWNASVYV